MATVLTYRNDGDLPYCEVALDGGDRVVLRLDRGGAVIERQASGATPAEVLFHGDAGLVEDICVALRDPASRGKTTPLDLLLSVVTQLRSAEDIRNAFGAAVKQLAR